MVDHLLSALIDTVKLSGATIKQVGAVNGSNTNLLNCSNTNKKLNG